MMSGFIAAVLAIPCTAPVLGMVATFAIQGRIDELLLIFISIATGFSLPYIIGIFWVPRIPSNIGKISGLQAIVARIYISTCLLYSVDLLIYLYKLAILI